MKTNLKEASYGAELQMISSEWLAKKATGYLGEAWDLILDSILTEDALREFVKDFDEGEDVPICDWVDLMEERYEGLDDEPIIEAIARDLLFILARTPEDRLVKLLKEQGLDVSKVLGN